jgi:hypothetical protein
MKIGSAFPSKHLKQEDLGGQRVTVVMDRVEIETVGQGDEAEEKPVLYFKGKEKGLALNRTNASIISNIVGTEETNDWLGKRIVLYVDPNVFYAGKRTGGIRVAEPGTVTAPQPTPGPADDDPVPF